MGSDLLVARQTEPGDQPVLSRPHANCMRVQGECLNPREDVVTESRLRRGHSLSRFRIHPLPGLCRDTVLDLTQRKTVRPVVSVDRERSHKTTNERIPSKRVRTLRSLLTAAASETAGST